MSIKRIDPKEFQQLGFLQEANRQFFHPHGLALELTTVTGDELDEESFTSISIKESDVDTLKQLVNRAKDAGEPVGQLVESIEGGKTYRKGDAYFSGVWDYRDDPEGIVFGSGDYGDSTERAMNVATQRAKHADARKALFESDSDIEPLDWTYPDAGAQAA